MAEKNGSAGGIFLAFVLGGITGAALALLWAPAPGTDTRKILGDKARESKEKASEAARQGREFINRQRETINTALERGKEAYQQARGGDGAEKENL